MDRGAIDVLDYRFGEFEDGFDKAYRNALWFGNNPDTDQEIRERFEDLVLAAGNEELSEWKPVRAVGLAMVSLHLVAGRRSRQTIIQETRSR